MPRRRQKRQRTEEEGAEVEGLRSLPARLQVPHDPEGGRRRRQLQAQEEERQDQGRRQGQARQVRRGGRPRRDQEEEGLRRADDHGDQEATRARRSSKARTPRANSAPAQNGIEAISVNGLVLKNMWARNYESNGFFVHAATQQRPALQRLHDGQPAGLRQPLLRPLRQGLLRRQDGQLGRLPPGRLRLLRRRNALRQDDLDRPRPRTAAPARRSRSGRC